MLYISAQPAEYYFLWQLEIQLQNFEEIGILPQNIHVLLAYKEQGEIPSFFKEFVQNNSQAQFFFYPDKRVEPKYLSSIRPHILKQHFNKYSELETKTICYHDSDIIFRVRLNEEGLSKGKFWYFSDTRNYISASYLKRFGNEFFTGLCNEVKIDPQIVERNEAYSGGAQQIMKGVTCAYWTLVEEDAERIYTFIKEYNSKLEKNQKHAQAWCADMWAVLWCAWKMDKEVRLHDDLLFSWPKDHISRYNKVKIFHNSGVFIADKEDYFCKLLFKECSPYSVDYSSLKKDCCSVKFVEKIQQIALKQKKKNIQDCTLLIGFDTKSVFSQQRIIQYVNYLYKHMSISIHLLERSNYSSFDIESILGKATYTLYPEEDIGVYIKKKVKTAFFIYTDANILLPVENILKTVALLQSKDKSFVYPLNELLEINNSQYKLFKATLEINKWDNEKPKSTLSVRRTEFVESYAMSKFEFIKSGGNNLFWHFFYEDGFNLEKQARYRFLGFDIRKVNYPAYKLFGKDDISKLENKNSIKEYLDFSKGSLEDVERQLAYGKFSFKKPYSKRKSTIASRVGFASLKDGNSLKDLINVFNNNYINSYELSCNETKSTPNKFYEITQNASRNKMDYIILITEEIDINQNSIILDFLRAIEDMPFYGLQVLSTISTGEIYENENLSRNMFVTNLLPASSVYVIDKSLFNKIIETSMDEVNSVEQYLNNLSKHVGVFVPFIGKPKALCLNDEKYMVWYKDRISFMNRSQDRLVWISNN